ncbi:signal transduction histidine kinase [Croceifilum oryzae]|uniref:histidine kinase n=1 Tax=Croceifilum oryzae TaxID=1553429 RepID=A0AAJ1WNX9_9BACL|nr:sensor histidine kinase [Croceifilum oryzae]MDQ0415977.1 signal transduction histidine kinase [Croceifilum oryzae]
MRLFFKVYSPFVLIYVLQFLLLYYTLRYLDAVTITGNVLYIFLVSLFPFAMFLLVRFGMERSFYQRLEKEWDQGDEFLGIQNQTPLTDAVKKTFSKQHRLLRLASQEELKEKQEHIDFIYHWVHQLKTPLSALKLTVQAEEALESADDMQEEIDRIEHSLNMVLYLSRIKSFLNDFYVEQVSLNQMATETINEMKRLFIRKEIFPVIEAEQEFTVPSDRKWLKFVLFQLLTNAIRYTSGESKRIKIRIGQRGREVYLSVIDQGVGIASEDIPRVFDLYFTGKNGRVFGESTGIGLFLVKKICDELTHEVHIQSELNQGTKVTIVFQQ